MKSQESLELIKKILAPKQLSYIEEIVFLQTWDGKLYREIAEKTGYEQGYLKDVGSGIWLSLSQNLGCQVTKKNLRFILTNFCELKNLSLEQHLDVDEAFQKLEFPGSALPFNSPFYIKRPPVENIALSVISQEGSLIRIKAPQGMGKTSLINHIIGVARLSDLNTVFINVQQADTEALENLDRFLRWFCWTISQQLNLKPKIDDYWFESAGSKLSCTIYMQEYVLNQVKQPIIVAIDKLHSLVEYPNLAKNFLSLLRSWYEQAKGDNKWQKLRFILAQSGNLDLPLEFNQSPFNVGLPLSLPELTIEQINSLAELYELHKAGIADLSSLEPLYSLIGGNPYLLQIAFYWLRSGYLSLAQLLEEAPTEKGIYGDYLRRQKIVLQRDDQLIKAFYKLLFNSKSIDIDIDPSTTYQLERMGLIKLDELKISVSCELYRKYFSLQFGEFNE